MINLHLLDIIYENLTRKKSQLLFGFKTQGIGGFHHNTYKSKQSFDFDKKYVKNNKYYLNLEYISKICLCRVYL